MPRRVAPSLGWGQDPDQLRAEYSHHHPRDPNDLLGFLWGRIRRATPSGRSFGPANAIAAR